jgi:hypothetical protein
VSTHNPVLEFFKRGEVARDVRLLAAQGGIALRAHEQLGVIVFLLDDSDAEIRAAADETLSRIPLEALQGFLGRSDIPIGLREFFADRGVFPVEMPQIVEDEPLVEAPAAPEEEAFDENEDRETVTQRLQKMSFTQRLKAASKGTKEMRAILIRDPNKMIAATVLSSPKVSEQEVASFAKMGSVSDDVLRIIGHNRAWMKNYSVVLALVKNAKTPLAMSMNLLQRLQDRDVTQLSVDRNVPEPLRVAARKKVVANTSGKG